MTKLRCRWCHRGKLNPKPAKLAYKMARGLMSDFKPICKTCYEQRRNNPFMEFKELEVMA